MVGSGEGSAFLTPVVWLFIAMLVAVPLLAIVRATVVDGTLDWSVGLGLFIGVMFGAGLVLKGGAGAAVAFGVLLIGVCGAWPFVSHFSDRKNLKTLRSDDIERLESAVQFDPSNAGAHAGLAEKWVELGRLDSAVDEYRIAIRLMPDGPATKRWKSQLRTVLDRQNGVDRYDFAVCRACDKDIPKNAKTCPHCGAVRSMGFLRWSAKRENLLPALRDTAPILAAIFLGVALMSVLPPFAIGVIFFIGILVGGWFILQRMSP